MADRRSEESSGRSELCKTEVQRSQPSAHVFPRILRSVIVAREGVEVSRIRAGTIRTPDHVSVLVTAFLRRGKPGSALKPSIRLERQASKDIVAHLTASTLSCRLWLALLAN